MSADGKSAYVTNQSDNTVSQFTVAGDGTLSPKTPPPPRPAFQSGRDRVEPEPADDHVAVTRQRAGGWGQSVTITGTGFAGASSVEFGTSAASSVVVVSSTKITVKTPAHAAGMVDVQVATPGWHQRGGRG